MEAFNIGSRFKEKAARRKSQVCNHECPPSRQHGRLVHHVTNTRPSQPFLHLRLSPRSGPREIAPPPTANALAVSCSEPSRKPKTTSIKLLNDSMPLLSWCGSVGPRSRTQPYREKFLVLFKFETWCPASLHLVQGGLDTPFRN